MTEKTAKRIAKSLEILSGQNKINTSSNNLSLDNIGRKLIEQMPENKLLCCKVLNMIGDIGLKQAKAIVDRHA